jgi:DNA-binding NarL/FixJ family response regulator
VNGVTDDGCAAKGRSARTARGRVVVDLVLAVFFTGLDTALTLLGASWWPHHPGPLAWAMLVAQAVACMSLVARSRAPITVVLVLLAFTLTLSIMISPADLITPAHGGQVWAPYATVLAAYGPVQYARDRRLAFTTIALLTLVAARPWDPSTAAITTGVLRTAAGPLVAMYLDARKRLVRALTERAERAEREQHLLAEQARAEERARLAGEMHDIVTHRVSLMVLQAGALGVTARDERTRQTAEELRVAGCRALDELRDLVGILRATPGDATPGEGGGGAARVRPGTGAGAGRGGAGEVTVTIRVVVVDDEPMVCAHLRTILGSAPDLEVVDEAHDGAAGVEAVARGRPDVVLMDLRMPVMDGLAAIERIGRLPDPPSVVALTTFDADEYVLRALRAGATGFLVKSTPPEDLIGLVRVAADGHTVLSPEAARRLVAASADRQSARERARELVASLTEREVEVLGCLGAGMSNAGIGARLYLSEATVKGHVSRMLVKLGCANRTQAGLLAHDAGLVAKP